MLTGWCYRLAAGPPSRVTLVPIETFFLVAAYALFWCLSQRLFGRAYAGALTLMFALGQNSYTALESTNDGFDTNETYMLVPMLAAVYAHLAVIPPVRRGLLRGLGIGCALLVKQSAAVLCGALIVHVLFEAVIHRRYRPAMVDLAMTVSGVFLAVMPVLVLLGARGWLSLHLADLRDLSGLHVGGFTLGVPPGYVLLPLLPAAWWVLVGGLSNPQGRFDAAPTLSVSWRSACVLVVAWFGTEAVTLATLIKPATHYYQLLVIPAVLTAGFGITRITRSLDVQQSAGMRVRRWVGVTTAVLLLIAAMPVIGAAVRHGRSFDRTEDERVFSAWLAAWPAYGTADALRKTVQTGRTTSSGQP